jgi:hypothetical protein
LVSGRREAARGSDKKLGLEKELQSKLYQPRVANLCDLAKLRAIREVSIGIEELCVIKDVEQLGAEINTPRL